MTTVKICGITRREDALAAADLGADLLGFIFAKESPRYVDPERAAEIAAAVRPKGNTPRLVGVFRDESNERIREIAGRVGLDLVQLHGTESEEDVSNLGLPSIKALRVSDTLPDTTSHPSASWLLFDTYDPRQGGGTGQRFDWSLLALYARTKPFFLSGGLKPENIAAAISLVRPDGVDIASGVESSPGIKDHDKLERLFERVRR